MTMTNSTLPMLHTDAIGAVRTERELLWQRWRDQWGVPLSLALMPMLLLVLSGELAAVFHLLPVDGHSSPRDLRLSDLWRSDFWQSLARLQPVQAGLAGLTLLGYLAVSVAGLRVALRDCYAQTWMSLTRLERDEFEALATSIEAVDELATRVSAMHRTLVVQDLIQARWIARLTTPRPRSQARSGRADLDWMPAASAQARGATR
jgi:hypothetical protein